MLEKYFSAPKTLRRLRSGLSGPHIDAFAKWLAEQGYVYAVAGRYLRAASHLGRFVQRRRSTLADIDVKMLQTFQRHLLLCRCPRGVAARLGITRISV
jgi:hypothetical protein